MEPILLLKSSKVILHRVPDVFAPGPNLCRELDNDLSVNTDIDAIMKFLSIKESVKNTISAYCKEVETFLLWLEQKNISFTAFTTDDCVAYSDFLNNPKPLKNWVGTIQKKILIDDSINPKWRPFRKSSRSNASVRSSLRKIHTLYRFLKSNCYLYKNPVPAYLMKDDSLSELESRYNSKTLSPQLTRFILKVLAQKTDYDLFSYSCFEANRAFLIIYILLEFGLKITELSNLKNSDVISLENELCLKLTGSNERYIKLNSNQFNVIDSQLVYMADYFDIESDVITPLVSNTYKLKEVTTRQISTIIGSTLMDVSKVIIQNQSIYENTTYKKYFTDDIEKCQMATAQWLRNSFGTAKVESKSMRPIEAMKTLGNNVPLSVILYHVNSVKIAGNFTDKHRQDIENIYDQMVENESKQLKQFCTN